MTKNGAENEGIFVSTSTSFALAKIVVHDPGGLPLPRRTRGPWFSGCSPFAWAKVYFASVKVLLRLDEGSSSPW